MSENNNVFYEVAQMMNNKNAMKSDMQEIMETVSTLVKDKYVNRINNAIQIHQHKIQKTPPKEIQLMQTLKLFMPDERHEKIDRVIESMFMINTFQNMKSEMSNISGDTYGNSIHEDGVYDVDSNCLASKNNPAFDNMTNALFMMKIINDLK